MKYSTFSFLYPPRPDKAIGPDNISMIERQGYVAQVKKNGTCSVVAIGPNGTVIAMNRHNQLHKAWQPDKQKMAKMIDVCSDGWTVFVAELLHSKVSAIRDVHYIHDILVHNGEYLVGMKQSDRYALLVKLFNAKSAKEEYSHYEIDEHTWVAKQFIAGFKTLYDGLDRPEDEGIVMKRPNAPLALCSRPKSNNGGMLKTRKHHKNFTF